ncbi:hypothetical protein DEU56DRAFT_838058 [Suillus clintonianus]|uniref:uncharacterized protein n=1 Tax=Suillus clintonianus TaxID=1904413 RepID=UPI001B85BFD3|nr:uncharacterized protein DEU56DRAFT_838058 [Suillus clintonianus]KAG2118387.1 hypothetical protein DEU56DRAFT_838058 [Suillus clintonianus]
MQTANADVDISPFSDIIGALRNILARSQVIIPNLETPYPIFPNTDYSTVELEGQSVLDIIAERQQQLDTVLCEISGLEAVMTDVKHLHQQLVEKKDKITQSMNLHRGLVSALWRFPNELFSQIFHHSLPSPDTGSKSSYLLPSSRLKAPMLLTGICRRWRDIATSTPSLWCRLAMEVDDTDWERAASGYDSWLKRSRGLPLALALKCSKDNHSIKLRTLLHPYMNQILSLSISFFSGAEKPELLLTGLPTLQQLTIYLNTTRIVLASVSQLPSTMRNFTALLLSFEHQRHCLGSLWAHLTGVGIGDVSQPGSVLELLQLCPNLSSLTIRGSFKQIQTLEPLTHPRLQSLRIHYSPSSRSSSRRSLSDLFDALSLPNLRALEALSGSPDGVRWPHWELKASLARSKCPLESLIFGSRVEATDEQRAEYVTLIPSLKIGLVEETNFTRTFG